MNSTPGPLIKVRGLSIVVRDRKRRRVEVVVPTLPQRTWKDGAPSVYGLVKSAPPATLPQRTWKDEAPSFYGLVKNASAVTTRRARLNFQNLQLPTKMGAPSFASFLAKGGNRDTPALLGNTDKLSECMASHPFHKEREKDGPPNFMRRSRVRHPPFWGDVSYPMPMRKHGAFRWSRRCCRMEAKNEQAAPKSGLLLRKAQPHAPDWEVSNSSKSLAKRLIVPPGGIRLILKCRCCSSPRLPWMTSNGCGSETAFFQSEDS